MSLGTIIIIVVGVYLAANLLPSAITTWTAVNTTGWGTADAAVWGIGSLVIVVAILFFFMRAGGITGGAK